MWKPPEPTHLHELLARLRRARQSRRRLLQPPVRQRQFRHRSRQSRQLRGQRHAAAASSCRRRSLHRLRLLRRSFAGSRLGPAAEGPPRGRLGGGGGTGGRLLPGRGGTGGGQRRHGGTGVCHTCQCGHHFGGAAERVGRTQPLYHPGGRRAGGNNGRHRGHGDTRNGRAAPAQARVPARMCVPRPSPDPVTPVWTVAVMLAHTNAFSTASLCVRCQGRTLAHSLVGRRAGQHGAAAALVGGEGGYAGGRLGVLQRPQRQRRAGLSRCLSRRRLLLPLLANVLLQKFELRKGRTFAIPRLIDSTFSCPGRPCTGDPSMQEPQHGASAHSVTARTCATRSSLCATTSAVSPNSLRRAASADSAAATASTTRPVPTNTSISCSFTADAAACYPTHSRCKEGVAPHPFWTMASMQGRRFTCQWHPPHASSPALPWTAARSMSRGTSTHTQLSTPPPP